TATMAILAIRFLRTEPDETKPTPRRATQALLASWWLTGPILFWALSNATNTRIFAPRYMGFTAPAQALLLVWLASGVLPRGTLKLWTALFLFLYAANPISLKHHWETGSQDQRPLFRALQQKSAECAVPPPVFYRSELPESDHYGWQKGNTPESYLYAPFVAYPVPNRLIPLPMSFAGEPEAYTHRTLDELLPKGGRFFFMGRPGEGSKAIVERSKAAGFKVETFEPNEMVFITLTKGDCR
ncbi:MAG TPA: hypothetical protein VE621_06200, partial [Bryobacteraceae bacterium]|nr:hypothetical protein [Bryobacteraceae bacterium]